MVEVDCLVVSSLIDSTFMKNEVFSVTDHISLVSPSSSKRWAPCLKEFPLDSTTFRGGCEGSRHKFTYRSKVSLESHIDYKKKSGKIVVPKVKASHLFIPICFLSI